MLSTPQTTEQVLATSHGGDPESFGPCLLVYPLPSIADESFLETIFCCKVRRSVFSGFGRHRFAIVELYDAERAARLSAWASKRLAEEKNSKAGEAAPPRLADDDDADPTLAEIAEAVAREQAAKSNDSKDFDHLANLRWNGKNRIYVAPSPLAIQELFDCGGVVPRHKPPKEREAHPPTGKREVRGKRQPERAAAPPSDDVAAPRPARTDGGESAAFPKGCCQKCGSSAHFTRHCDGSGPLPMAKAEGQTESRPSEAVEVEVKKVPSAREEARPHNLASTRCVDDASAAGSCKKPTFTRTSKDQCKHCGSEEHLSRHCPNK